MDYGSQAENSFQLISFASHHILLLYATGQITLCFHFLYGHQTWSFISFLLLLKQLDKWHNKIYIFFYHKKPHSLSRLKGHKFDISAFSLIIKILLMISYLYTWQKKLMFLAVYIKTHFNNYLSLLSDKVFYLYQNQLKTLKYKFSVQLKVTLMIV